MGQHSSQLSGKASCHPAILSCAAWRRDAVASMYERWLDGGANFLVDERAFGDLLGRNAVAAPSSGAVGFSDSAPVDSFTKLFKVFDPEQTGMADAYEAMLAVALCSRMETKEKTQFAMLLYNFDAQSAPRLARSNLFLDEPDGSGDGVGGLERENGAATPLAHSLSKDELTLMLRTVVVGASRVDEQVVAPETDFFEKLASKAWDFASKGRVGLGRKRLGADERVPQKSLVAFLGEHAVTKNFLVYFEQVLCQVHISEGFPMYGVFQDSEFPPSSSSLYCNPDRRRSSCASLLIPNHSFSWTRMADLCADRPVLFADGVRPAGMVQGYLANSCFVSTANALIDWPRLLQNVFVGTGQEAQGRYCCKLYKNGDWKHIVVDDYVPCDLQGAPIYATCVDINQVWPMVLEKVYAKAHGSYENIAAPSPGTRFEHVLRDLTGGHTVRSKIDRQMKSRDMEKLWKSIYEHSERRSNITAFARLDPVDGDSLRNCSEEERERATWFKDRGLMSGCLYSVVNAFNVKAPPRITGKALGKGLAARRRAKMAGAALKRLKEKEATKGKADEDKNTRTMKLLELRYTLFNSTVLEPTMWNGDWCIDSPTWEHSDVPKQIGRSINSIEEAERGEGVFFMAFEDAIEFFDTVFDCKLYDDEWVTERKNSAWTKYTAGGCPLQGSWTFNNQFALEIAIPEAPPSSAQDGGDAEEGTSTNQRRDESVKIVIELSQPEMRHTKGVRRRPFSASTVDYDTKVEHMHQREDDKNEEERSKENAYGYEYQDVAIGIVMAVHDWESEGESGRGGGAAKTARRVEELTEDNLCEVTETFASSHTITVEAEVPPGRYVIIPMTYRPQQRSDFTLTVRVKGQGNSFRLLGPEDLKWSDAVDAEELKERKRQQKLREIEERKRKREAARKEAEDRGEDFEEDEDDEDDEEGKGGDDEDIEEVKWSRDVAPASDPAPEFDQEACDLQLMHHIVAQVHYNLREMRKYAASLKLRVAKAIGLGVRALRK